jgi:lipid-A-disaccharide synthase-like uncharacterized protein
MAVRGIHASRTFWDRFISTSHALPRPGISLATCAAMIALFLCLMASVFGAGPDGVWLSLPPDYTTFGWTARLIGAAMGLAAFTYLYVIRHQQRSRRSRRSFPATLVKFSLMISIASITWEIALLAAALICVIVLAFGMFGEDGF